MSLVELRQVTQAARGMQCPEPLDIYNATNCPAGYYKLPPAEFATSCSLMKGSKPCPSGWICLCQPCKLIPSSRFAAYVINKPIDKPT